ncbi:hypothetical protein OS493_029970 [Desmophyllum pertusum]|uniref:Glucose-methanol-choline oxidoreductase N-terminal domain-containing protein n=1 Tax=Desmophyllum pertusum TaxID=174260 RepID=A0A9W9ZXD7_9CNID|nr:hypothetical protein OS493_029970 [Desmophyllum pertusum]
MSDTRAVSRAHNPYFQQRCFSPLKFSSTHDYVICGAGSAGCVLANCLSANPENKVLLLEAGPKDWTWKIHMPAALSYNLWNKKYNWYYETEEQEFMDNRRIYQPRGRVWGGSSSLNSMVYIRGHAYDYDRWEKEGAESWSYADCLPYFRKSQTHELGPDDYRGGDGPLNVSLGKSDNPLYQAFIDAGVEAGYPFTEDMNGYQQEGFGRMDMTIHKGVRWNTANAYLRPALKRKNLRTDTRAMITRIVFEKNRAVGVEYHCQSQVKRAMARKGVILTSGAINTPQILNLSGIGNAEDLKKLGIPVQIHLPGVGYNLQDHLDVSFQQECTQPLSLYRSLKWWNMVPIGVRWFLTRTGPCATGHIEAGGFIRSGEGISHPNIQYHFVPLAYKDHGRVTVQREAFQVHVGSLRATSRGYVKLKSLDPYDHPIINPNYLSTEEDRVELRDAVRLTRKYSIRKLLRHFVEKNCSQRLVYFNSVFTEHIQTGMFKLGDHIQTDEQIDAWVRQNADTVYHPSCTCKMGAEDDPMAVVNSNTEVFGVENLRIVDASIMPSIVSGNLNGPTVMIAEKAADIILGKSTTA